MTEPKSADGFDDVAREARLGAYTTPEILIKFGPEIYRLLYAIYEQGKPEDEG